MHEIVSYIERNYNVGYKQDELRFMLIKRGYSRSAIERAFRIVEQKKVGEEPPKLRIPPKIVVVESEKEEPTKPKGPGFFSKIKQFLTIKPKTPKLKLEENETVKVDEHGNLVQ